MLDYLRRLIGGRRYAYNKVFVGEFAPEVLADLAHFCRAHESTFHPNERLAAMLDGRREVWLRIQQHLKLSPDELYEMVAKHRIHQQKQAKELNYV